MQLITKRNQTVEELSQELLSAIAVYPEIPELKKLMEVYVTSEQSGTVPQNVYDSITNVCGLNVDATSIAVIQNTKMKISPYVLAWLAAPSCGILNYLNTIAGALAVVFYTNHAKEDTLTLQWVNEVVGAKVIPSKEIFPYHIASKMEDGSSIYTHLTPELLYKKQ